MATNTPTKNADGSMRMTYSSGDNINYNGADLSGLRYYDISGTTDGVIYSTKDGGYTYTSPMTRFIHALTGLIDNGSNVFTKNNTVTLNGRDYTFYNAGYADTFNTYDAVAAAVDAGYSYNQIDKALEASGLKWYSDNLDAVKKAGYTSFSQYINERTLPAAEQILNAVKTRYPNSGARIITRLDAKGNYTFTLEYNTPNGKASMPIDPTQLNVDSNGKLSEADLNTYLNGSTVGQYLNTSSNAFSNAQDTVNTAEAVLGALGYGYEWDPETGTATLVGAGNNVGSNANAHVGYSQADANAAKAKLPGTDNLHAWNNLKNEDLLSDMSGNFTDPTKVNKAPERLDLPTLQELVDGIINEDVDKTTRDINSTKAKVLDQIRKDPQLYNAIVQQFRTDNAAGTVAGQRAANAQGVSQEFNKTYDEAADNVYKGLFEGENNVSANTRNSVLKDRTDILDSYIQAQLNNASQDVFARDKLVSDVKTATESLRNALDVDLDKYTSAAKVNDSKAAANTSARISAIDGNARTEIENQTSDLDAIANLANVTKDVLLEGMRNNTDVSAAVNTLLQNKDAFTASDKYGYKIVNAPTEDLKAFENKQYNSVVNNKVFQSYIDNAGNLTKNITPEELMKAYGLEVLLTDKSFMDEYAKYASEANTESDKVFNQAQRAYIAAITAGDAKTADQLTRLATSTGGTKGNLYAASALANQYNQQTGLTTTGRQLAADYQNQQSDNATNIHNALLGAYDKRTEYLGNGYYNTDKATINGTVNKYNDQSADLRGTFMGLHNKTMTNTQGMTNVNADLAASNNTRAGNIAAQITASNASKATSNTRNATTRNKLAADWLASLAQNKKTIDDFAKNNP